jgi:hypothetical protein
MDEPTTAADNRLLTIDYFREKTFRARSSWDMIVSNVEIDEHRDVIGNRWTQSG